MDFPLKDTFYYLFLLIYLSELLVRVLRKESCFFFTKILINSAMHGKADFKPIYDYSFIRTDTRIFYSGLIFQSKIDIQEFP